MTKTIKLPKPEIEIEFPLMKAIQLRRTKRRYSNKKLSNQEISNILWVACGITHKKSKTSKSRRTAPSACNSQEIKVYLALKKGLFLYDEEKHQIIKILSKDIRKEVGTQKMLYSAPARLIYVSDYSKLKTFVFKDDNRRWFTSTADAGFMGQNVYLYCASAKLGTAFTSLVNRDKLHKIMKLKKHEKIVYSQTIGHLNNQST